MLAVYFMCIGCVFANMDGIQRIPIARSVDARLSNSLSDFTNKHEQFNYGIQAIETLYDSDISIDDLYGAKKSSSTCRKILFGLELVSGSACSVLRCLSAFHPQVDLYGKILVGCSAGKALFWGLDAYLHNSSQNASIAMINTAQADPKLASYVSTIMDQVNRSNIAPVLTIAKGVIDLIKQEELNECELEKFQRLQTLTSKLAQVSKCKKIVMATSKILAFLLNTTTGITIAATGQESSAAYWLTLVSEGFDPIVDCAYKNFTKKPIVQKYINVCEIIYLCNHFLDNYGKCEA